MVPNPGATWLSGHMYVNVTYQPTCRLADYLGDPLAHVVEIQGAVLELYRFLLV